MSATGPVRRHLPSLIAVVSALAVGIALGGGPLGGDRGEASPADAPRSASADHAAAVLGSRFAAAIAPTLYDGRLSGHPIAVVSMPGAEQRTLDGIDTQVVAAGGTLAGHYAVRPGLSATSQRTLVDSLGRRLAGPLGGGASHLATYPRIGRLVATAVASSSGRRAGAAPGGTALTIRESLQAAGLVTTEPGGQAGAARDTPLAAYVVLVLGSDGATGTDPVDAQVLEGLVRGLDSGTSRLVIAGDADSATDGALADLRGSPSGARLTTVDGDQSATGQVGLVLALISGARGAFGASGSDGAASLG